MEIDLVHTKLIMRKDGIVQIVCSDHEYTLEDIENTTKKHGELTKGGKCLLLVVTSHFTNVESKGREFMASHFASQYSIAEAFVIHSLGQKILANFYLKINKPKVPTKVFTNVFLAEEWLKEINESYLSSDL